MRAVIQNPRFFLKPSNPVDNRRRRVQKANEIICHAVERIYDALCQAGKDRLTYIRVPSIGTNRD